MTLCYLGHRGQAVPIGEKLLEFRYDPVLLYVGECRAREILTLSILVVSLLSGCSVAPQAPGQLERFDTAVVTQSVVTISNPLRPGVRQRILMVQPEGKSRGVLILFPGGDGAGHFQETDRGLRLSNNFLVRSSDLFALEGFTAAIIDAPSDEASGMSDGFRTSPHHMRDVRGVVDFLAENLRQPVFLVGTSRGTLSVAFVATAIGDERVKGIVLTSSYDYIGSLPLEKIRYPVLFVHHRDDTCRDTPYSTARQFYERVGSSAKKNFITVVGGSAPISKPCEALSYHGFLGKENEVVRAITDWISGQKLPSIIGP